MIDAAVAVALANHGVDAVGRHAAAGGGAQVGGSEDDARASYALKLARHVGLALEWVSRYISMYSQCRG